jgi:hypothetical protein
MKSNLKVILSAVVVAALLASPVVAKSAVRHPAAAARAVSSGAYNQPNQAPGWDACFALAMERGSGPNKEGGTKGDSQYNSFMKQCRDGKIPMP